MFNRVSLSTENPDEQSDNPNSTLRIKLDEKLPTVLRIGVRYDETSNAQLLLDFRNENLYGTGNSAGCGPKSGRRTIASTSNSVCRASEARL